MIPGFEDITAKLSEEELSHIPLMVEAFKKKIGEGSAVTADTITRNYKRMGVKMEGPRVRKIVNYIRMKGLLPNLVATSKGYYIEPDPVKLKKYVMGLKMRAKAINAVADSYQI